MAHRGYGKRVGCAHVIESLSLGVAEVPSSIAFVNTGTIQQNASTLRCIHMGSRLASAGSDVHLLLTEHADNRARYGSVHEGMTVHYAAPGSGIEPASKLRLLRSRRWDVIHCMSVGSSVHIPGFVTRQRQGGFATLVMDFDEWQSRWVRGARRPLYVAYERFACAVSDRVIFASRSLAATLGRGVADSRRFYLPYAVDVERFEQQSRGWEGVRASYGGRRLAVYMGSLLPQFDAGRVLDAVKGVVSRHPSVLFLFVGAGSGRAVLERRVATEGLRNHVRFLGHLPDVEMVRHLRAAEVLLFPIEDTALNVSRSPNKTFLYMAAQRPVVTNRVGNVADVLGDEALYFDFSSASDFVDKIDAALSGDSVVPSAERVARHTYDARYRDYVAILAGEHTDRTRIP